MTELLARYPSIDRTVKDGRWLMHYDSFREWIRALKEGFIAQKDYEGYPTLPECWLDGMAIYADAPEDEREMMASALMTDLTEALRHWKRDRDDLYGTDCWTDFWESG